VRNYVNSSRFMSNFHNLYIMYSISGLCRIEIGL
jgi:hypothetical protein